MSGYLVVDSMDVLIFVCLEVTDDGGWRNALHLELLTTQDSCKQRRDHNLEFDNISDIRLDKANDMKDQSITCH